MLSPGMTAQDQSLSWSEIKLWSLEEIKPSKGQQKSSMSEMFFYKGIEGCDGMKCEKDYSLL